MADTETKTPIYLENVLYMFEKYYNSMRQKFILRGEVTSGTIDLVPLTNAVLQVKDAINNQNSNTSEPTTELTVEDINKLIDEALDEKLGTDEGLTDEEIEAAIAALHTDTTTSSTTN